jgi:hypothetical protein
VGEVILDAASPASLEVALQVFEEIRTRKAEVDRIRRATIERAREEAEVARRQYMLVRPENRLVADTLERQWNEKLSLLSQAEEDYRKMKQDSSEPTAEDRERIQAPRTGSAPGMEGSKDLREGQEENAPPPRGRHHTHP